MSGKVNTKEYKASKRRLVKTASIDYEYWEQVTEQVDKVLADLGVDPIADGVYDLFTLPAAMLKVLRVPPYLAASNEIKYLKKLNHPFEVWTPPAAAHGFVECKINRKFSAARANEWQVTLARNEFVPELARLIFDTESSLFTGQHLLSVSWMSDSSVVYQVVRNARAERLRFHEGNGRKQSDADMWMRDPNCKFKSDKQYRTKITTAAKWWLRAERNHNPKGETIRADHMKMFTALQDTLAVVVSWFEGTSRQRQNRASAWAAFGHAYALYKKSKALENLELAAHAFARNACIPKHVYGFRELADIYGDEISDGETSEQRMYSELLNMLIILLETGECKKLKRLRTVSDKRIEQLRGHFGITTDHVRKLLGLPKAEPQKIKPDKKVSKKAA